MTKPYSTEGRIDQTRWSLEKMKEETGVGVSDLNRRVIDYGIQSFFTSHHPWIVPEPFTPEPCETYSKADIDYWVSVVQRVSDEAYSDPELVRSAPHNAAIHKVSTTPIDDPDRWAMTWRAYLKKRGKR
ncbi:glycine dehydrogenase (decarboxylating) subunit 2 [subsurface metagenome]